MAATVSFVRCDNYEADLEPALTRLFSQMDWAGPAELAGKGVLIKPNLLTERTPEQAVTTHPEVVRHVIRRLKAAGARVTVGDSPASTANLRQVWRASGIEAVCAAENVPLISLEQAGATAFEREGFAFTVANPVLKADLIVNLQIGRAHV